MRIRDPGKPGVLVNVSGCLLRDVSLARPCEESWAGPLGPWQGRGGGTEGSKSLASRSCRLPAQRLLIRANWHRWWQAWVGADNGEKVLLSVRLQEHSSWAKVQPVGCYDLLSIHAFCFCVCAAGCLYVESLHITQSLYKCEVKYLFRLGCYVPGDLALLNKD